jgi:hypothetical protein
VKIYYLSNTKISTNQTLAPGSIVLKKNQAPVIRGGPRIETERGQNCVYW